MIAQLFGLCGVLAHTGARQNAGSVTRHPAGMPVGCHIGFLSRTLIGQLLKDHAMSPTAATNVTETGASSPPVALKQQARLELRRLILSEELPAGTVQSVRQLASRLNMSKTPVHAAIERLEAEGLVTLAPQQGVVVREISLHDIVNHYQLRQALEPFVVRRLAGRLTSDQLELLKDNQARHRAALDDTQLAANIQIDAEFHHLLCEFLGNEEITHVMQQLRDRVQRAIYRIAKQFPERITNAYDEHEAILDALVSGDEERAAELAYDHLENGLRRFWPGR